MVQEWLAKSSMRWIGIRWGDRIPYYYVSEHPKSGGTWLSRMVGDYLEVPFPRHTLLPHTFPSIVQNHWRHHPRLNRVFYLYRDGRDVMVSSYYHRLRIARHSDRPARAYVGRTYEKLFGTNYDPEDIVRHLPRFIEYEFANPGRGSALNWRDHVDDWVQPGREDRIAFLSYEELSRDCATTLAGAIRQITGEEPDPWRVETAVEKFSMGRHAGRQPGEADATKHIRKGVVGDWQNHFSREAAEVFDQLAGETLVRLGYEDDRGWADRYSLPSP